MTNVRIRRIRYILLILSKERDYKENRANKLSAVQYSEVVTSLAYPRKYNYLDLLSHHFKEHCNQLQSNFTIVMGENPSTKLKTNEHFI